MSEPYLGCGQCEWISQARLCLCDELNLEVPVGEYRDATEDHEQDLPPVNMQRGDYVKWVNQITGQYEYGVLRYSYETKWGTHWSIDKLSTAHRGDRTTHSQRTLEPTTEAEVSLVL